MTGDVKKLAAVVRKIEDNKTTFSNKKKKTNQTSNAVKSTITEKGATIKAKVDEHVNALLAARSTQRMTN